MYKAKKEKRFIWKDLQYLNKMKKAQTIKCKDCWWYITYDDWTTNWICIKCISKRLREFELAGWKWDELKIRSI